MEGAAIKSMYYEPAMKGLSLIMAKFLQQVEL